MTSETCDQARESISASADGELQSAEVAALDDHLQSCPACRTYHDEVFALRRAFRLRVVGPPTDDPQPTGPDVANDLVGSLQGVSILRWALFVIGGVLIAMSVPSILSTDGSITAHLGRHDGVYGTALGVAMIAVSIKPHRAIGLVPLTSTIAALMAVAAVADLATGNASPLGEAIHLVEFAGLVCLWVISGGPARGGRYLASVARFLADGRG